MATIDDAIFEVIRGAGTMDEKKQLIDELRKALPSDRWTFRYVIWGLIAIVIIPTLGVFILWVVKGDLDPARFHKGLSPLRPLRLVHWPHT